MPFIESVPTTEYMIAVNLAPSSLSEPKLNLRPIAGARKILSAKIVRRGHVRLVDEDAQPLAMFRQEAHARGVRQGGQLRVGEQALDRFLKIVLGRVERRCLKSEPGIVMLQPCVVQPEDLCDPLDPSLTPLRQPHLASRAVDKVSPCVAPAE